MRRRVEAISIAVHLCVAVVTLFHGQCASAQVGEDSANLDSEVDHPEFKSLVRAPRQTYFARIIEEKTNKEAIPPVPEDAPTSDEKGEDVMSGSSSSSSSSEEEVVLGTISSTTANPTIPAVPGGSVSPQKKRLQFLSKVQQGRLLTVRESEKGGHHNWYSQKSKLQGRSIGGKAQETSKSDEDSWGTKGTSPAVPVGGGDSGGANSVNGGGGDGGGASTTKKHPSGGGSVQSFVPGGGRRPFNVVRAKPSDYVDPDLYNFFQFRPYSKLGWLWLMRGRKTSGRLDLLPGDKGGDDMEDLYKNDWEYRRYDRACLYVEFKKQKSDAVIPLVQEELKRIVDTQNEQLARRFLDWQFINKESHEAIALQEKADKHPLHITYKFLYLTMELFRDKICRNATSYAVASASNAPAGAVTRALATAATVETKLLPKPFIEELFRLFLTLREITLTKNVPDYATPLDEEEIYKEVLEKCMVEEEAITWFSHSCGDQILSSDEPNNFACTPLADYDYNTNLYDPILDGMWHMFNSVHAYCFKQFQINTRLWHKYSMIIANAYTVGMRQRWKASMASQKFYMRLLGPDHQVHLETMNRCMFGSVLRSDVPAIMPRFDSLSPITFGKERIIHKDGASASG